MTIPTPNLNLAAPAMAHSTAAQDGNLDYNNVFQGSAIVIGDNSTAGNATTSWLQNLVYVALGGFVVAVIMKVAK